jgi:hypothetical protein
VTPPCFRESTSSPKWALSGNSPKIIKNKNKILLKGLPALAIATGSTAFADCSSWRLLLFSFFFLSFFYK